MVYIELYESQLHPLYLKDM